MVKLGVIVHDAALKLRIAHAIAAFKDLRPEMKKIGEWLLDDAGKRLEARDTEYRQYATGRLNKSLRSHPFMRAVTITSVQPYARTQQLGGIVQSTRPNGYLAIPMRPYDRKNHVWPRHWSTRLLCIRREDGKLYLFSEKFREFVYRLVKSVKIPARPYLVESPDLIAFMRKLFLAKLNRL